MKYLVYLALAVIFATITAFVPKQYALKSILSKSALNVRIKITVNEDEPIENIIKRFKKACGQSGHLIELRFKEEWENAHDKRKRKSERAKLLDRIERTNDKYEKRFETGNEYN